jgi:hypothetical protein
MKLVHPLKRVQLIREYQLHHSLKYCWGYFRQMTTKTSTRLGMNHYTWSETCRFLSGVIDGVVKLISSKLSVDEGFTN